jgi:osmotically-inducible protein OsmY
MTRTQVVTDVHLNNAVIDELTWQPSVDSAKIRVKTHRGVVTLSGEVGSFPERLLAEQAALRVRGVTAVAEEITVRHDDGGPSDADIARRATEALEHAVDVPGHVVQVVVCDHVVTLTGMITWQFQRDAADRAVRYIPGVTGVHNAMTIKPTVSAIDLKSAITSALVRNAALEGGSITVTTELGSVTLEGRVRSSSERLQAGYTAWAAPGVTDVANLLQISN